MVTFSLRASTVLRVLLGVAVALLLLSALSGAAHLGWGRLGRPQAALDLDREGNVPTWWSSLQLGLLVLLCFHLSRRDRGRRGARPVAWLLCGAALLYVSVDEVAQLHEQLSAVFHTLAGRSDGVFRFGWVFLALPVVVVFVLVMVPLLLSLPRTVAGELLAGGAVFLLGAVALEMVGSALLSAGWSRTSVPFVLQYHAEEFLEMTGVAVAFHAVARYAASSTERVLGVPEGREMSNRA